MVLRMSYKILKAKKAFLIEMRRGIQIQNRGAFNDVAFYRLHNFLKGN